MKEIFLQESALKNVCAVVPVQNEGGSIGNVLRQVHRAGVCNCVVVVNGSTDETPHRVRLIGTPSFTHFRVVEISESLGPDVPKAVGTFVGLREFPEVEWFLYVDGDWKGSFGPMLRAYLGESLTSGEEVHWVHVPLSDVEGTASTRDLGEGERFWQSVLAKRYSDIQRAAPSRSPLLVQRRVFNSISAYWLHHPGRWFALCVLARSAEFRMRICTSWDARLVGNPTRSRCHALKMAETLLGDAVEGCCLLYGKKPSRTWNGQPLDGYHSLRRTDLLQQWQSQL